MRYLAIIREKVANLESNDEDIRGEAFMYLNESCLPDSLKVEIIELTMNSAYEENRFLAVLLIGTLNEIPHKYRGWIIDNRNLFYDSVLSDLIYVCDLPI